MTHPLAEAEHHVLHAFQRTGPVDMARNESSDDLCIHPEVRRLFDLGPDILVVHHNAVMHDDHTVTDHRLIVERTIGDKTAVTEDKLAVTNRETLQKACNPAIRPQDFVAVRANPDKAAAVLSAALGPARQGAKMPASRNGVRNNAEDTTHGINPNQMGAPYSTTQAALATSPARLSFWQTGQTRSCTENVRSHLAATYSRQKLASSMAKLLSSSRFRSTISPRMGERRIAAIMSSR